MSKKDNPGQKWIETWPAVSFRESALTSEVCCNAVAITDGVAVVVDGDGCVVVVADVVYVAAVAPLDVVLQLWLL